MNQAKTLFEQIRANSELLERCEGPHHFERIKLCKSIITPKYQCSKCGGIVDSTATYWYEQGIKHGGDK